MTAAKVDFSQIVTGMADERNREGGMNDPEVSTLMVSSADMILMAVASAGSRLNISRPQSSSVFQICCVGTTGY